METGFILKHNNQKSSHRRESITQCKSGQFRHLNKTCSLVLCITFCLCYEFEAGTWMSPLISDFGVFLPPLCYLSYYYSFFQQHAANCTPTPTTAKAKDLWVTGEEAKCPFAIRVSLSGVSATYSVDFYGTKTNIRSWDLLTVLGQMTLGCFFYLFLYLFCYLFIYLFILLKIKGCVLTQVCCHWEVPVMNGLILTFFSGLP